MFGVVVALIGVFAVSVSCAWRGCRHLLACLLHQFVVFGVVALLSAFIDVVVGIHSRVCCIT